MSADPLEHTSTEASTTIDAPANGAAPGMARSAWRGFRRLPIWAQATAAVVLLAVVAAPIAGTDPEKELVTAAGSSADAPAADTTTTTQPPETTTTAAPPTTAAPTMTVPPPPPTTAKPAPVTTAAPATTSAPRVTPTTAAPPPAAAASGCHSSYQGTCIPPDVSDADCAGGSGNGPYYVLEKDIRVVGTDVFDLDGNDNDGLGCES
ncbi:MAG TPA: hypothetical protein VF230_13815 [Acidimicrobiales bacterium]